MLALIVRKHGLEVYIKEETNYESYTIYRIPRFPLSEFI